MSDALTVGLVGTGAVALKGVIQHLVIDDIQDRMRLTCLCDVVPGRARAAADKFGVPNAYEDYEEMLDREKPDVVTLATPIGLHYEQGRKAIQRGIHVHFNKTMATTTAEADELISMAKASQVKLVASPGQMLYPFNREVRRLVQSGVLGELTWAVTGGGAGVLNFHLNERQRGGDDVLSNIDPTWYLKPMGGGLLYDLVVYPMHTLTGILGPAKAVTALSGIRAPRMEYRGKSVNVEVDNNTLMLLDFGQSFFAFVYGAAAGGVTSAIFGTKGAIRFDREEAPSLNGRPIDFPGRGDGFYALPHVSAPHREVNEWHIFEDIMQLVDWVREDKPTVVTAEHARHVIDIFESACRSARTGRVQELRTTFAWVDPLE